VRGLVVDLNDKYAVVLSKKGEFIRVKNNGKLTIGQEIDMASKAINCNFKSLSKVVSIAAGFLLVLGIGIGLYVYNIPYNYINIDINPSVEFTVNIFNMVLDAEGLNNDGKELLKKYNYKHLKIDKVIEESIKAAVQEGFLGESNENAVLITVSGKNYDKLSNIQKELLNTANVTLQQDKVQSEVVTEKVTLAERNSAKELGISPGKLVLIEKLKEKKPDIEVNEYKKKPVKDILSSIKQQAKKDIPEKPGEHNMPVSPEPKDKAKVNEPEKLVRKDIVAKNLQEKDKVQKVPEPKDKIEKETKSNEITQKPKTPIDTKLKEKKEVDKYQKIIDPKDSPAEDKIPKDNEPKPNKLQDSHPKNIEPKDIKPESNQPKAKDDKPKAEKPEDNKTENKKQEDGKLKDNVFGDSEVKIIDIKEFNKLDDSKDKSRNGINPEKDKNKP